MKLLLPLLLLSLNSFAQASYPTIKADSSTYASLIREAHYESAITSINKEIQTAKRKRQSTTQLDSIKSICVVGINYLKGTDKVTILDSAVVSKSNFLSAYGFSSDLGTIRTSSSGETTEYETERANRIFRSEPDKDGHLTIYSYYKENGKELYKKQVQGLDVDGDLNYPFMMTDGVTFYFAARSAEGLGNYDLYVTRYDSDEERFYKAENLGFPYNSYANDYLMVVDEENQIGWFASDRHQPKDKVCIYTFIPNSSRHAIDYESTDTKSIISAATLRSYKATWDKSNEQARISAKQRLSLQVRSKGIQDIKEFTLVINDNYTYTSYAQFHSAEAKEQCKIWQAKLSDLKMKSSLLAGLRDKYATTRDASVKAQIETLETEVNNLTIETKESEKLTRKLELQ